MEKNSMPEDAAEFELVIKHNVLSGAFSVSGHSKNRLVALGMLDYARGMINRENAKQALLDEMRNAPLILPGKGPV
jgi:hypothetical protein